jgi:hypothetical protein
MADRTHWASAQEVTKAKHDPLIFLSSYEGVSLGHEPFAEFSSQLHIRLVFDRKGRALYHQR